MNCLICGGNNLEYKETVVSDFVMARIEPLFVSGKVNNYPTKLCYCHDCTFAFYDYRFTEKEETDLYRNYRDAEYQKMRQRYEPWYTAKINDALNNDHLALSEQKRVIRETIQRHETKGIGAALDYGGNEGKTFYPELGTEEKYVYDISGVECVEGVCHVGTFEELLHYRYDFIMCNMLFEHLTKPKETLDQIGKLGDDNTLYYIEVPSENPFVSGDKFSLRKNISLAFNPRYNVFLLAKSYLAMRRQPFMPMKEHINFFTTKSMRIMLEKSGFECLEVRENPEKAVLGDALVLSALFRKKTGE